MEHHLLFLLLLAPLVYCVTDTIKLSASLALTGANGSINVFLDNEVYVGMKLYVDLMNKRGGIDVDGITYTLELNVKDSQENDFTAEEHYIEFCEEMNMNISNHFLITSPHPISTVRPTIGLEQRGCPSINAGGESDFFWRGPKGIYNFTQVVPLGLSPKRAYSSMLPFIRIKEMKTAVLVCGFRAQVFHETSCDVLQQELPQFRVKLLETIAFEESSLANFDFTTETSIANWTGTADRIASHDNLDVMIISTRTAAVFHMLKRLVELDKLPRLIVTGGFDGFYSRLDDIFAISPLVDANLMSGISRFVSESEFPADIYTGISMANFTEMYTNATGRTLDIPMPVWGFLSCMMWVESIKASKSLDATKVLSRLLMSEFETFNGIYSWDPEDRSCRWDPYYVQLQVPNGGSDVTNALKIIAPLGATTNSELVYPTPLPHERVVSIEFGRVSEIIMTVFTVIALLIVVAFSIFVGSLRNNRIVRGSSVNFLLLVAFGALLLLVTNFVWLPSQWTTFTCHLAFYTFNIGFSVMFGSLFAKSLRVVLIMRQAKRLKVIVVSDAHVFICVLGFVTIDIVLLLLYSAIAFPQARTILPDPYYLSKAYLFCEARRSLANQTLIGVMVAYKCVLMLFGIYTGWQVHYIKYKHLNESKVIAFALYNVVFFAVLGFGFSYALNDEANERTRYGLYALRSLSVILGAGLTIVALFIQKILLIEGLLVDSSSLGARATSDEPSDSTHVRTRMAEDWETKYNDERTKNTRLKKKNAALKAELQQFKGQDKDKDTEAETVVL